MTAKRDPNTTDWKPITIRVENDLHGELKMLARKDRRSTQNLINKILADWCQEKREGKDEN